MPKSPKFLESELEGRVAHLLCVGRGVEIHSLLDIPLHVADEALEAYRGALADFYRLNREAGPVDNVSHADIIKFRRLIVTQLIAEAQKHD